MKLLTDYFGKPESPWQAVGWVLVAAFVTLSLVVDHVASTVFAIFFLAGLWLLIRGRYEKPDPLMKWVLIVFAAYFLVGVLSFFLGEEQTRLGEKILGRDLRFLAAAIVSLVIVLVVPARRILADMFAVAAIVTGLFAIVEVVIAERTGYRAGGRTIAIVFGHLSAGLFAVNLTFALHRRAVSRVLPIVGSAAALAAVVLSGTRGAFFSVLLVAAVLGLVYVSSRPGRRLRFAILIGGVLLLTAAFGDRVLERIRGGITEIRAYQEQVEQHDSFNWPRELPACFNDRNFLDWFLENSITSGEANLRISVDRADRIAWSNDTLTCNGGYAITIVNSDKESGWIYLPQRSVSQGSSLDHMIFMKGKASVSLALTPRDERVRVDNERPEVVRLDGASSTDARFLVILYSGDSVQFAPVLTVPSEYSFSNLTSSVGSRLLMWPIAAETLIEHPFSGRGTGTFPSVLEEQAEMGRSPWQLVDFDHAHNEILNTAAERGILGLIALFGVYAAPFWLFYRRRDVFGVAGMAFVGSIFISGFTETIFNHSLGITYYSMFVLLLATAPREPLPPSITRQED